ncbi:hypothetical protein BDN70DRAFT_793802 [Pholiota conissans]|uniref:Ketoreductase (KR) domain-containing protein n=1 Tax=Pholiota conissans TaxID=109636 RepID=A0A9P6D7B5_9AGAR|nr:hypothetical protein BDN70DRAFT_793802 [Pholiota conissans]
MVLRIAEAFASRFFPTHYLIHIGVSVFSLLVLRALSQGRKTDRERDLHARIILVTGGFTPLGLTLLQSLAQRGAHVIALSQDAIDSSKVTILIDLLRTTTSNEQIYAEECDLSSPSSVRAFCTKFLTGNDQRLDAIIFAHEHRHIGSPKIFSSKAKEQEQKERDSGSLATFLITILLLPALLVAPPERDIRIVNIVNPFYAAASGLPFAPKFSSSQSTTTLPSNSIFLQEGIRSLRTIVFTRHLQRILDALPSAAQVPKTEEGSKTVPVISEKLQKSNIVAISVSPGISRVDTISSLLLADLMSPTGSYLGVFVYLVLQPLLRILTKSPIAAVQSVLHVLFLPTPFKIPSQTTIASSIKRADDNTSQAPIGLRASSIAEEMLKPGALYANCAVVKLDVKIPTDVMEKDLQERKEATLNKSKGKGKENDDKSLQEVLDIKDDGEYGGELAGRLIWEEYEGALKIWEQENPGKPEEKKETVQPPVAQPQPKQATVEEEEDEDVYR